MSRVDLWDTSDLMRLWCSEEEPQVEEIKEEPPTPEEPIIPEAVEVSDPTKKYVVELGVNSRGYMQYISGFDDEPNYTATSVVPYPTTMDRCKRLIEIFKEQEQQKAAKATVKRPPKEYTYNIVEYRDKYACYATSESENIARGKELIRIHRESKIK